MVKTASAYTYTVSTEIRRTLTPVRLILYVLPVRLSGICAFCVFTPRLAGSVHFYAGRHSYDRIRYRGGRGI